ncbi:MAG: META domain-containing protein [Alphaproteobacteria bacterium]|nr:META domain-containing protein [Alphaproteobacteria bacterium]
MRKNLTALALLLPLVACAADEAPQSLRGKEFTANVEGTTITLNFAADENRVFGQVVNRYNGPYEISGGKIKFGMFASTMMMGINETAMRVEREFFKFMPMVESYKLSGNELLLKASDGQKMTFEQMN